MPREQTKKEKKNVIFQLEELVWLHFKKKKDFLDKGG